MSSQSTGPTFPATETFANSPQNDLLPMELPLTALRQASHAKVSASRAKASGFPIHAADYGVTQRGSLASWHQDTQSWKTAQCCLVEGLETFSETWPRSGMMRNGTAYQLATLARPTSEIVSGLLPTPTVNDAGNITAPPSQFHRLSPGIPIILAIKAGKRLGNKSLRMFAEWMMGYEAGWTSLAFCTSETP